MTVNHQNRVQLGMFSREQPRGAGLRFERSWWPDLLVFVAALAVSASAMSLLHAFDSGLSGSDEGSHFLNGYLIWSYLTHAFGQNPLSYATDFYIHYPKISIGHWPPLYYVFLGALFFVLPHVPMALLVVNLVVATLPALVVSRLVRLLLGLPWAALAAMLCVVLPISLNNMVRLMLDQALALVCLLAALLWSRYARDRTVGPALAYAVAAGAAVLIKGNGWAMALFPLIHIVLTRRWSLLWNWRTLAAALLALVLVGAWTAVTYKISSDGFNYAWGWSYFSLALPTFLKALYANLGFAGTVLALAGAWACWTARHDPALRELGITSLALVLATVLFHAIVPVDLDARYLTSALFPLAVLMTVGTWALAQRMPPALQRWQPWAAVALAMALLAVPGVLLLQKRPARFDLRMSEVAQWLARQPEGMVVVIDGDPGAEGALIAEVALRDKELRHYVVRSSQLLSKSDFMGHKYALKAETPGEVLRLLDQVSGSVVVLAEGRLLTGYPHNAVLKAALQDIASPYRLVQVFDHKRQDEGRTFLYVRDVPLPVDRAAVRRVSFPEKAM